MSAKVKLQIFGALSSITGFCVIGYLSSWWVAIGVFIMLFGNNVERRALRL